MVLLPRIAVQAPPAGTLRVGVLLRLDGGLGQQEAAEAVQPRPEGAPSSLHLLAVPLGGVGEPLVRRPDPLRSAHPVGARSDLAALSSLDGGGVLTLLAQEETPLELPGRAQLAPGRVPVGQGVLGPRGGGRLGFEPGAARQRGQAEVQRFFLRVEALAAAPRGGVFGVRRPRAVAVTRVAPGRGAAVPVEEQDVAAVTGSPGREGLLLTTGSRDRRSLRTQRERKTRKQDG